MLNFLSLNQTQKIQLKHFFGNSKFFLSGLSCTMGSAVIIGTMIATSVINPNRLLSLPYIPEPRNCTAYLQEFNKANTLAKKQTQLFQAINCLERLQYPKNQDYFTLKNNFTKLSTNPSVDQFLEISQSVQHTKIDQTYLKTVTAPPIARYLWLSFPYLVIELIFILIGLVIWLILINYLDYYFLDKELFKNLFAIAFVLTILMSIEKAINSRKT